MPSKRPSIRGSIRDKLFQKKPEPAKTPQTRAVSIAELFSLFNAPTPSNDAVTGSRREYAANGNVYRSPNSKLPYTTRPAQSSTESEEMRPPPYYLEDLKTVDFAALTSFIKIRFIQSGGQHTQHYLNMVTALEEKYQELKDGGVSTGLDGAEADDTVSDLELDCKCR